MTERLPHRPFCGVCNNVVRVDFYVPDDVWERALHESHRHGYICLDCFTRNADERGVDWSVGIEFRPLPQVRRTESPENISVAQVMKAHGWTTNEIGAAIDGRYRGMALDAKEKS